MHRAVQFVVFVWLAVLARDGLANAAQPWDPGDPLSEPVARIRSTEIVKETLHIDARALAEGGTAAITATYRLLVSEEDELPLVFVSPGVEEGTVELDGKPLALVVEDVDALPGAWQSPATTPDGVRDALNFATRIERVLTFTAPLQRGEHELVVRYRAQPTLHHGSTLVAMQLAYVLAPARDWRAFGALEIEVLAPEAWSLRVTPALRRDGSRWYGTFEEVPADALSMTFRPPEPVVRALIPSALFLLGLIASVLLGLRSGARLGRRFTGCLPAVVGGFVVGTLGATLVAGAYLLGREIMTLTLPAALVARDVDYASLGTTVLGMLLGFAVAAGTAAYARSRVVRAW